MSFANRPGKVKKMMTRSTHCFAIAKLVEDLFDARMRVINQDDARFLDNEGITD